MFCNVSKVVLYGRRNTFATISEESLEFSWQAQCFPDVFGRFVAVFVAGATLWTRPSPFCVAGAALSTCRVACFSANRIGRAASSGDRVQIPWQAWHFMRCDEN